MGTGHSFDQADKKRTSTTKPQLSIDITLPAYPSIDTTDTSLSHPSPNDVNNNLSAKSPRLLTAPLTPLSLSNSKSNVQSEQTRPSSATLLVDNGLTGTHISITICQIAAQFWQQNIVNLSASQQLEIGCSIFFSMLSSNKQMKTIMTNNLKQNKKIEQMSLKYLDMLGWLITNLMTDNIDLYSKCTTLGALHKAMGVNIKHFAPMLQAIHETFTYYFPNKYTIEVKYAMDEIFSLTAQVMTGQNLKQSSTLMQITQFQGNDLRFLKDLNLCLKSSVGKDYLYQYLSQTWCDELVMFLKSLSRFKNLMTHKQRFMAAKDINKTSIDQNATFCLNLSHETREKTMECMAELENKFVLKEELKIAPDFFKEVEYEVYKLILENHWKTFVTSIETLQSKSFDQYYFD